MAIKNLTPEQEAELVAKYAANEYKEKRRNEYPPISEYLDGIVKGDQEQIDAHIAACQAIKNKYPKPTTPLLYINESVKIRP